jgi:hypothetical protein
MAAGIVNSIHHRPLGPIANLRENVEPCKRVTGISAMISKMMLAPYPKAIPWEDMREVAREGCIVLKTHSRIELRSDKWGIWVFGVVFVGIV